MMKNNLIISAFSLGLLTLVNTSCENAENPEIANMVYFSEAASAKAKVITLESQDVSTSLTVRLAKAIDSDVNVTIAIDESVLADYNYKNETDYKVVDAANMDIPSKSIVSAGAVSAEPTVINIHSFNTHGSQYAIPVRITSVDGQVDRAEASSKFIFILEQPLIQPVPTFHANNKMKASPETEWGLTLSNYTLEWWSKMSGFRLNNQAIFYCAMSDTELSIRFGDEIYGRGVFNFLQIKALGKQFDTGDPGKGFGLNANTWYHFALTYDASTGTAKIYKNGEEVASMAGEVGKSYTFNSMALICSGTTWFVDACELAQVRMWKTTRSAGQIKANMNKTIDATNKDLVLYLPMDEGSGTTLNDITGNGHDTVIGNNGTSSSVTWNEYTFK